MTVLIANASEGRTRDGQSPPAKPFRETIKDGRGVATTPAPPMLRGRRDISRETGGRNTRNPRSSHAKNRVAAVLVLAVVASFLLMALPAPGVRAQGPTLAILSPANDAIVGNGSPVALVFRASDFNLTEPGTGGPGLNEGHAEVLVDGALYAVTAEETVLLTLPSGTHDIQVRLVADDGTGLDPEVTDSVTVTTTRGPAGGPPTIAITYPADRQERGPDTAVSFRFANFTLVPPGGPPGVPHEGHIEVRLDGRLYQYLTVYKPVFFSDLSNGEHTVTLRLVDNAHNPLSPDVIDSVIFRVTRGLAYDVSPWLAIANAILAGAVIVVLFYPIQRRKR